jgi:hypothetical protein
MAGVLQSGSVTPGHLVGWVTDGVVGDLGAPTAAQKVIASLRGANFNIATDQPILIPQQFTAFQLTGVLITNASVSMTTAAGGFYPQASKGGSALVAAATTYALLTSPDLLLSATLTSFALTGRLSANNLGQLNGLLAIWLSLTTPQGAAATADVYLLGVDLT